MGLSKWWRPGEPSRPQPALPEGRRIYAIGDIHGRADLLAALVGQIEADLVQRPAAEATTILLGDYVDRGPDSRDVIDRLVRRDFPTPLIALRGNHDDILLGLLVGQIDPGYYAQLGGEATLASYGVDPELFAQSSAAERLSLLDTAVPDAHCAFLDTLPLTETIGDYFFCHAGVRPGVALDKQTPEDLMWIREPFLESTADFGKVVIHGHTPVREPHIRVNGINIDTRAFSSGILTAIVLEGLTMRFLRTA